MGHDKAGTCQRLLATLGKTTRPCVAQTHFTPHGLCEAYLQKAELFNFSERADAVAIQ